MPLKQIDIEAAKGMLERERRAELRHCQNDLYYLATEKLGYKWNPEAGGKDSPFRGKGLTDTLHKPICNWWDERRKRLALFLEMQRWGHKSTVLFAAMIQDILRDPSVTLFYLHAVEEIALAGADEVGHLLQFKRELRELEPIGFNGMEWYDILPNESDKHFNIQGEFTVNRSRYSRYPTLFAKGAGSEIGGAHCNKAYLDDILGRKTMEEAGGVAKIDSWLQNTVMPVVDDGMLRAAGTTWGLGTPHERWLEDPAWCSIKIPASVPPEYDLVMNPSVVDWSQDKIVIPHSDSTDIPTYGPPEYRETQSKKLDWFKLNMKEDYDPQMNLNATPHGELLWDDKTCYHRISRKEALSMKGMVIVLSDPAPAKVGSLAPKKRSEVSKQKDYWADVVVKICANGDRQDVVFLEVTGSREWSDDDGINEIIRLKRTFGTPYSAIERSGSYGISIIEREKAVSRVAGVSCIQVEFETTQRGKNARFSSFVSRAKMGQVLFCEELCDRLFLERLLTQARRWRPNDSGGNGLPHDDFADIAAYSVDPGVMKVAPKAIRMQSRFEQEAEAADEQFEQRSRYGSI